MPFGRNLHPFNDWVDANCFFTVGKSMMNGVVVYRDLFEQKGPFLYFIHGIAWLISNNTFFGVYVIEILAAFVFLYFSFKTVTLLWENANIIVIPVIGFLIYTSTALSNGDSAEELCLPFVAYAIWVSAKAIKQKKDISLVQYFIIGICSGCVFWTKFTLVGFYIGWFMLPAFYLVKDKNWKRLGKAILAVALGVLVATLPYVIYFGVNGAIGDCVIAYNASAFYLGVMGLVLYLSKNDRKVAVHFMLMMVFTHFLCIWVAYFSHIMLLLCVFLSLLVSLS